MSADAFDEWGVQQQFVFAVEKNVNGFFRMLQVAAFDECGAAESLVNFFGGPAQVLDRFQFPAGQDCSFIQVRRYECGEREQTSRQQPHGRGFEQTGAAGGNHYGINNQRNVTVRFEKLRHYPHDPCGVKHPGLHRRRGQFLEHRLDLSADDEGFAGLDGCHALWVLRRNARDGAGAMHAERGERFQVRLDARAAAAVGTGDGERHGNAFWLQHARSIAGSGEKSAAGLAAI